MGIFDIFKKKRCNSELDNVVAQIRKAVFPGGEDEINDMLTKMDVELNNRYDRNNLWSILSYMSTLLYTSQDKSAHRIVYNGQLLREGNKFSEKDALAVYRLVVRHQYDSIIPGGDDLLFQSYYETLGNCEDGATTDEIPGGYGEYGLCVTNPIPVRGIPANEVYLKRLTLLSGEEITWERICSMGAPNISMPIDAYQIKTKAGKEICVIYISPYQNTISNKAPKGFSLK